MRAAAAARAAGRACRGRRAVETGSASAALVARIGGARPLAGWLELESVGIGRVRQPHGLAGWGEAFGPWDRANDLVGMKEQEARNEKKERKMEKEEEEKEEEKKKKKNE